LPRGGKRVGAGRKRSSASIKSRHVANSIAESGAISPLEHMIAVLNDPNSTPARKDLAAAQAAPYLHPRLGLAPAHANGNGGATIANVTIVSVPHGAQYDAVTGLLKYDGLEVSPPAWRPLLPTPDIGEKLESEPESPALPLPVIEAEPEPSANVTPLSAWRRREEPGGQ
jgi:hypothetical protein